MSSSCKKNPISDFLYTSQGKLIIVEKFIDQTPNISQKSVFSCADYNKKILERTNSKNCQIQTDMKNDTDCTFKITCKNS
jgi:hypothetical protein